MALESLFRRPTAKRDIIGDRKIINVYRFEDIVPAHEVRKADEVVIIAPQVEIIPGENSPNRTYIHKPNFRKRGPLVEIPTFSEMEMMARQWSDLKARIQACEDYSDQMDERYVGWVWTEPGSTVKHILHPSIMLEGHRLFIASQQSRNIDDKIILRDEPYRAKDSPLLTIRARVPKRHGEEGRYGVVLEHITSPDDIRRYVEWTRVKSRHECGFKEGDISFKFPQYISSCPHDVAAYDAYSAKVAREQKVVIPQPYPLSSEPMMRLHLSLLNNTMRVVVNRNGARESQSYRPLSLTEENPILMYAWLKYGNRLTFYLHKPVNGYKRMSDFDITPSAAGLPFLDPQPNGQ